MAEHQLMMTIFRRDIDGIADKEFVPSDSQ
jgi:hypothetical protein